MQQSVGRCFGLLFCDLAQLYSQILYKCLAISSVFFITIDEVQESTAGDEIIRMSRQCSAIAATLLLLASGAVASSGSGGGGKNGGGGNSGGGHGGGENTPPVVGTAADVCNVVAPQGAPVTIVPGTILARDTFGFGPQLLRPTGGNGTLKPVAMHTGLNGFWAEQPCSNSAVWMTASGSGVQSWNFSITNTDPKEPPSAMMPAGLENGAMTVFLDGESVPEFPTALLPLQAPSIPYEVSAEIVFVTPNPGTWFGLGFTSSNALNRNFEAAGQAWMRVRRDSLFDSLAGTVELHTNGLAGPSASASVVLAPFSTLRVQYDPLGRTVNGYYNDLLVGTLSYDASSSRFVGFEGAGTLDNFVVKASN